MDPEYFRVAECDVDGDFSFTGVPAGSYMAITLVEWRIGALPPWDPAGGPQGGYVAESVTVHGDDPVSVAIDTNIRNFGAGAGGDAGGARGEPGRERADRLYRRVFDRYGDDSVARFGGAHVACEGVSNILTTPPGTAMVLMPNPLVRWGRWRTGCAPASSRRYGISGTWDTLKTSLGTGSKRKRGGNRREPSRNGRSARVRHDGRLR